MYPTFKVLDFGLVVGLLVVGESDTSPRLVPTVFFFLTDSQQRRPYLARFVAALPCLVCRVDLTDAVSSQVERTRQVEISQRWTPFRISVCFVYTASSG